MYWVQVIAPQDLMDISCDAADPSSPLKQMGFAGRALLRGRAELGTWTSIGGPLGCHGVP